MSFGSKSAITVQYRSKGFLSNHIHPIINRFLKIKTPVPERIVQRPPLAVVCTLDRSGSMSGNKIEFARHAIEKVIKHLDITDTFHLVSYDQTIVVEIKNGDLSEKESLKQVVRSIRHRGSTNICDALTKSASLLSEADLPPNALKRIFLFSDGEANAGEIQTAAGFKTLAAQIFEQQQISVRFTHLLNPNLCLHSFFPPDLHIWFRI